MIRAACGPWVALGVVVAIALVAVVLWPSGRPSHVPSACP